MGQYVRTATPPLRSGLYSTGVPLGRNHDRNCIASASELAATVRSRQIGCRELLDHYLDRVERFNPGVNAIVTLDIERAQKRADEADSALARGEKVGPLHGVPMTLKDTIDVAGVRTTAGAEKYTDHVPKTQGPVVQKLVDAGAIIFGKTNTPEMASDAQSYNSLFGTTNNPWDHARTPGGSSGGPGAAVAAGVDRIRHRQRRRGIN